MKPTQILKIIIFFIIVFPSGIGISVADTAINSSKLVLLMSYCAAIVILISRNQLTFQATGIDKSALLFGASVVFCSFISGIVNKSSIGAGLIFSANAASWFFAYFLLYFLSRTIPKNLSQIKEIEKFIVNLLILCALIGATEFLLKINFYGKIASAIGLKDVGGVTSILMRGDQVRARASFDQSIALGFAMIIGLILLEKENEINKAIFTIKWAILFIGMIFSFSRSSIAVFLLYIVYKKYRTGGLKTKSIVALTSLISLLLFASKFDEVFYLSDSMDSGDGNLLVRFRDFELVGYCLENYPLFGIGSGLLHNSKLFEAMYGDAFWLYDGALDNMFFGIVVEFGAIGLLSYFLFLKSILKAKNYSQPIPHKCNFVGLFIIGVGASVSYDVFVFPGVGRLFLVVLGLSFSEALINEKRTSIS